MQKDRNIFVYFLMACVLFSAALFPSYASATTTTVIPTEAPKNILKVTGSDGIEHKYVCPGNDAADPEKGFTTRLIPCIRNTIIYATSQMLVPFTKYFGQVVAAVVTLAIIVWGILVASGTVTSISQNGMMLAIKIGAVIFFTNSFGGYYPILLESLEKMLSLMASPVIKDTFIWRDVTAGSSTLCTIGTFREGEQGIMTIWNILDCYLELFIGGIFSKATLSASIIGFVIGSAFSTSVGMFIAMAGLYMLVTALFAIARTVYIFITSYIAFSFMVLISSIFIPCILFKSTKTYFDGWLQLTISFFIQPLFVFGYLVMFLVAFNTTIFHGKHSLYYAIAGEDSQKKTGGVYGDFQLGKWLNDNGVYADKPYAEGKMKVNFAGATKELGVGGALQPTLTGVEDVQGQRDITKEFGVSGINLDFFETKLIIRVIDWEVLAQKAQPDKYAAATSDSDKEIFYRNYKISVFIAFIMAAVFMYLFYSLLGYIPYIGNAAVSGQMGLPLGGNGLSMPGTKIFGGAGG